MPVELPRPIAAYIDAENLHDIEALSQCFAEEAVVQDEDQTIKGLAAIKKWKEETTKKYQHTMEPLGSRFEEGTVIVTNRLTGNFPGSPLDLEFVFTLEGEKISVLHIRS
jgi:hypothetical protein